MCRDPAMSVEVEFPVGAFRSCPEPAQIVGCLFQHSDSQTFFRRRRRWFGWRSKKMGAVSIGGFRIQKCGELIARQSRHWVLPRVLTLDPGRKHELTGEIAGLRNGFICYQVHHIDPIVDLIRFIPFSRF